MAGRGFADNDFLRNNLSIYLTIASDVLQQQTAGRLSHEARLVLNGREFRCDILGMYIIRKANQGDIIGNAKAKLLDGCKSSKGDDIVESKDGIRTVFALQQTDGSVEGPVVVDAFADNEFAINGDAVLTQSL